MSSAADDLAPSRLGSGAFARAPLPLIVVAALVALTGLAMTFVGAAQTGLSADEYAHVKRLEAFYDDGLFVRDWERTTPPGTVPPNAYVYAPGTTRVMHAFNQLAGNEGSGEVSASAEAFIVRHYVVAAMALAGTLAVLGLASMLLGSWRWGVVAAAALAAVPMWTGHAMFNPKDTPVGVGNTLMTLGLAGLALLATRGGRVRWMVLAASCIVAFLGITLMMGTRPGMWPALAAAVVTLVFVLAVGRQLNRWVVAGLLLTLATSYLALWRLYPKVFSDPVAMLSASAGQSTEFPHGVAPGRGYIVERTAIEWPVLLLGFMLVGTVVGAVLCIRAMRSAPHRSAVYGLVGAQAFALTLAAIIVKANVYDGLRQLLFAVPAQAILAAVGIAVVVTVAGRHRFAWIAAGAAAAALALPMVVQARLYPYQYAYGNVAAEVAGADILNDNWKVSFREYVEDVPPTLKAICPNKPPIGPPIRHVDFADCRGGSGALKPFWIAYWHHARFDPDAPTFYTVLRAQRPLPPNCREVDRVVRHRNLERAVMSRLLLCKRVDAS